MDGFTVVFEIKCITRFGESVFLVGSADVMGKWDAVKAVALVFARDGIWKSPPLKVQQDSEYKYFIQSVYETKWETRDNRKFNVRTANPDNKYANVNVVETWNDTVVNVLPGELRSIQPVTPKTEKVNKIQEKKGTREKKR